MSETTPQPTFEQAFEQLEALVEKLEAGDLPLDEAITLYQQGMALVKQCNQQLDQAELTVKQLLPDGSLADFDEA